MYTRLICHALTSPFCCVWESKNGPSVPSGETKARTGHFFNAYYRRVTKFHLGKHIKCLGFFFVVVLERDGVKVPSGISPVLALCTRTTSSQILDLRRLLLNPEASSKVRFRMASGAGKEEAGKEEGGKGIFLLQPSGKLSDIAGMHAGAQPMSLACIS